MVATTRAIVAAGMRQHAAARAVNGHADQLAVGGDERATLGGHGEAQIESQSRVDLAATGAVPGAAGQRDHPERGDDLRVGAPDRDGEMTGP